MYTILEVSGVCLISPEICFAMKKNVLKKDIKNKTEHQENKEKWLDCFFLLFVNN